ncbi:MAG TPA: PIG-L family deacetylase [bacterium]|nr:PIG-L family deacetylase [bacterium]
MRRAASRIAVSLLVAVGLWGASASGTAGAPGQAPAASDPSELPLLGYHPGPHDSVVVFAAHPDDESLGPGGFVREAVDAGARVTIVTFTNGDGYLAGVDVAFRTVLSTPALFVQYGARRQQEALAAGATLGVTRSGEVFLGYPDRGLAALWGSHWNCDHPYTSRYTQRDHSPYPLALRPGVAYCGANVLADVETVLRREHPSVVIVHHAADTHPDHWAAEAFVTAALESLALDGDRWARSVRVFHYIVHRGAWPSPRAYAPDLPLRPPADLEMGHVDWVSVPLTERSEDAQHEAILSYQTQITLLRSYMLSFVRRAELFDLAGEVTATEVADADLPMGAPDRWDRLPPAVIGSGPGSPLQHAQGSATLQAVTVAQSRTHLFVGIRLRRPHVRDAEYRIELRLFHPGGHWARLVLSVRPPRQLAAVRTLDQDLALPPGAVAESTGPRIAVSLPLEALRDPVSAYVEVATVGPLRVLVERTPWTMVRLAGPASGGGP